MIQTVAALRRIAYAYGGDVDHVGTPLEISYDDGSVELFDAGPDGETLRVDHAAWADPFAEPLSDVNRAYVAEHGKYVAVDLADKPPFDRLIGATIEATDDILNGYGVVVGRRFHMAGLILEVEVLADDLDVRVI